MLPEEKLAVYMQHLNEPPPPVWESNFGRGRHPRTYKRDWPGIVLIALCLMGVAGILILTTTL